MNKKLSLRRESVRPLTGADLSKVAGGMIIGPDGPTTIDGHPQCTGPSYTGCADTKYMNTCAETHYAPCL